MPVRVEQLGLLLTGVAQQLSTALSANGLAIGDVPIRELLIQLRSTNANPVYVGTGSGVSATAYGVRLPAPVAGLPSGPFLIGEFNDGTVQLGDFWVIGTDTENLHLLVVRYV